MKNILLVLSFSLLFACRDNESQDVGSIIGRWEMVSYKISNFENTGTTVDDSEDLFVRPYFEFNSNGKVLDNLINGKVREMNYEVKNNTIVFEKSIAFETHNSFSYKLFGNKLELRREDKNTMSNGNGFTEYTVIVLQR